MIFLFLSCPLHLWKVRWELCLKKKTMDVTLETIPNAPIDIIITPSTTNAKSWKQLWKNLKATHLIKDISRVRAWRVFEDLLHWLVCLIIKSLTEIGRGSIHLVKLTVLTIQTVLIASTGKPLESSCFFLGLQMNSYLEKVGSWSFFGQN